MPGWIDKEKQESLERYGYVYNFRRMVYVNYSAKKLFSYEAIRDQDLSWLKDRIQEPNQTDGWKFYFKSEPSNEVKSDLIRDIERA